MLPRPEPIRQIELTFQTHPVTALLGPRQCGKTTLARFVADQEPSTVFDLENPVDVQRHSAPMQALQDLSGIVIIDEVRRALGTPENTARRKCKGINCPQGMMIYLIGIPDQVKSKILAFFVSLWLVFSF